MGRVSRRDWLYDSLDAPLATAHNFYVIPLKSDTLPNLHVIDGAADRLKHNPDPLVADTTD